MTTDRGARSAVRRHPSAREVLLSGLLILCVAGITWWSVGPQTIEVPDPDVLVRAPVLSAGTERAVGLVAWVLGAVAGVLLLRPRGRRRVDRRWWPVLAALLLTAAFLAAGWRVLTAEVIGANIGAGLFLILGLPLVAIAVIGVVVRSAWLLTRSNAR